MKNQNNKIKIYREQIIIFNSDNNTFNCPLLRLMGYSDINELEKMIDSLLFRKSLLAVL